MRVLKDWGRDYKIIDHRYELTVKDELLLRKIKPFKRMNEINWF